MSVWTVIIVVGLLLGVGWAIWYSKRPARPFEESKGAQKAAKPQKA